jgi:hypothetical protein
VLHEQDITKMSVMGHKSAVLGLAASPHHDRQRSRHDRSRYLPRRLIDRD